MKRKNVSDPQLLTDSGLLDLNSFFPYQLRRTYAAVGDLLRKVYADKFELTSAEWRVLAILVRDEKITNREIVIAATIDKVAVTRAVQKLEKKELAERHPNPQDGRSELLSPSAKGLSLYRELSPHMAAVQEHVLDGLSSEERVVFVELLGKLEQNAITDPD